MISQIKIKELKNLLKKANDIICDKPRASHEDVRESFGKVFDYLGYTEKNRLHERSSKAGKSDLRLITDEGLVHTVVEFKRPRDPLDKDKLREYAFDLYAKNAVFTDGIMLGLYELSGSDLIELGLSSLDNLDDSILTIFYERFMKPDIPLTFNSLSQFVKGIKNRPIPIMENLDEFIYKFRLSPTPFSELVISIFRLYRLMKNRDPNSFAIKTFEIWKNYYAPTLKETGGKDKLKEWRKMLKNELGQKPDKMDLYEFMFSLETAYAMVSRIILHRVCGDYGFGVGPTWIETLPNRDPNIRNLSGIGLITYVATQIPTQFGRLSLQFPSIFEEDFFDWWNDAFEGDTFFRYEDIFLNNIPDIIAIFSSSLFKIYLITSSYSFKDITSDFLGTLYQEYFDSSTRKAFGEFYTPPDIVEYILDSIGYKAGNNISTGKTLIDPACGSGTFLIKALNRYLKEAKERVEKKETEWEEVLTNLCDGLAICGLDINPFAVLIAQINYAIQIIPYYRDVRNRNKYFRIANIPVFKTDTLRLPFQWNLTTITDHFNVELPISDSDSVIFMVPTINMLREVNVLNKTEAVRLLSSIYRVARRVTMGVNIDRALDMELKGMPYTIINPAKRNKKLMAIIKSIIKCIRELRDRIGDKRLAKWVGDELIVSLLKSEHEMNFDFVVCNPPYVTAYKAGEELDMCGKLGYHLSSDAGKRDLAYIFLEWGIRKMKQGGKLGYIITDKWMEWMGREKIRNYVLNNTKVIEIIDSLWIKVFEDARNYVTILTLEKTKEWNPDDPLRIASLFKEPIIDNNHYLKDIGSRLDYLENKYINDKVEQSYIGNYYLSKILSYSHIKGTKEPWSPFIRLNLNELNVMSKLENIGTKLEKSKDFIDVKGKNLFEGIVTAGNKIFLLDEAEKDSLGNELNIMTKLTAQGVDIERWGIIYKKLRTKKVLSVPYRGINWELIEKTSLIKLKQIIFPYIIKKGKWCNIDIAKYDYTKNLAMKKIDDAIKEGGRAENAAIFLKNSLQEDKLYFIDKRKDLYIERKPPMVLTSEKPRLICRDSARWNSWMLDLNAEVYPLNTCYFLVLNYENEDRSLYYLGLINSSIIEFYHKSWAPTLAGATFRYREETIHKYPIIPYDDVEKDVRSEIIEIVRKLIFSFSQIKYKSFILQEFINNDLNAIRKYIKNDIDFSTNKMEIDLEYLKIEVHKPLNMNDEIIVIRFLENTYKNILNLFKSIFTNEEDLNDKISKIYCLSSSDISIIDSYLKRLRVWSD